MADHRRAITLLFNAADTRDETKLLLFDHPNRDYLRLRFPLRSVRPAEGPLYSILESGDDPTP